MQEQEKKWIENCTNGIAAQQYTQEVHTRNNRQDVEAKKT